MLLRKKTPMKNAIVESMRNPLTTTQTGTTCRKFALLTQTPAMVMATTHTKSKVISVEMLEKILFPASNESNF